MRKIGILTRDCAGVNAAIRSIVRTASFFDLEVVGVHRGYSGLIDGDFIKLDRSSVSGIINDGGTILKTSRCKRFREEAFQKKAVDNIKKEGIDGLIVVGGNGSLTGAHVLADRFKVPVVGIPATIDNDISGVDLSIGADTAVNVAIDALDKIRDTATSLERIFIVEVMGRNCGYIALEVALAAGCEDVIVPEMKDFDYNLMSNRIIKGSKLGKLSWIVIVAEGAGKAEEVADLIKEKTGLETRIAVLGHIQRGGRPTFKDRNLAARLGNYAVKLLKQGSSDVCVCYNDYVLTSIPLSKAIESKDIDYKSYYELIKVLT